MAINKKLVYHYTSFDYFYLITTNALLVSCDVVIEPSTSPRV